MTLRLIALMTVVLVLSLASFGLLMGHYQQGVMAEVEQIVAAVGKATVRSIHEESEAFGRATAGDAATGNEPRAMVFERIEEHIIADSGHETAGADSDETSEENFAWIFADGDEPKKVPLDGRQIEMIVETLRPDEKPRVVRFETSLFLSGDGVHTSEEPGRGLVLRIPRFVGKEGTGQRVVVKQLATTDLIPIGDGQDDIVLPVPIGELQSLFAAARKKSLMLFVGVLMVGTAMSVGFAHRFTRPVRRLDEGLRQLSDGDLDVEVDVGGDDELGRLGRAFNLMAKRLRIGREREREVQRREQLAALGRLAAGVAHDVRNPLHSISLTLQHLDETSRPPEGTDTHEFDRSLEIIRGEIRRLDDLVGNFLRFARSDPSERELVQPEQLLQEVSRLVEREAERRGVTLEVTADDAVPPIRIHPGSIRSAILNLVLNSFEAMNDGGTVRLVARVESSEVVLSVSDTGDGIPADEQEKVFDFAYSTREDGHGLGLAMVQHAVVEDHGGRVTLESENGEGTTVNLAFPVTTEPTENQE